jgi:hypothetical protein
MAFCSHCGSPTAGGRFCSACGRPIARDAVAPTTADLMRRYKKMRLVVASLGLVFLATAVWMVGRVMHMERSGGASHSAEGAAPAMQSASQPTIPVQTLPNQASASYTSAPQTPVQGAVPNANNPPAHPPTSSIDPQEVQRVLNTLAQRSERGELSGRQPAATNVSGSDRYPGSQPVDVKDVSIPDIGVPVASEVYTTTDSIATVVEYYRQRYPEAEVTEVNGQKIVAVDQPGATKVIAVGAAGTETRIAIVQPAE